MASLNKATLIGNLGRDPEVRYAPSGDAICTLSIATTEAWKDKQSGERKEATEWHRVVLTGKAAENAEKYLKKGAPVYVEGKIKTKKWTDKDGVEKYTTEIWAFDIKFLGRRTDGDAAPANSPANAPASAPRPQQSRPAQRQSASFDDMDDDIPF